MRKLFNTIFYVTLIVGGILLFINYSQEHQNEQIKNGDVYDESPNDKSKDDIYDKYEKRRQEDSMSY